MMKLLSDQLIKQIDKAVEILRNGGVVAFPTDTVYGLGADVFNAAAVEKIYKIKQRPYTLPLPVPPYLNQGCQGNQKDGQNK